MDNGYSHSRVILKRIDESAGPLELREIWNKWSQEFSHTEFSAMEGRLLFMLQKVTGVEQETASDLLEDVKTHVPVARPKRVLPSNIPPEPKKLPKPEFIVIEPTITLTPGVTLKASEEVITPSPVPDMTIEEGTINKAQIVFQTNISLTTGNALEVAQRELIITVFKLVHYNKAAAARILGITQKTMYNKLELYGYHKKYAHLRANFLDIQ